MITNAAILSETSVRVTAISDMSGAQSTMDLNITPEDFKYGLTVWQDGELIQNAFPMLDAGEREFLKTGVSLSEWDAMFNGFDDEDED